MINLSKAISENQLTKPPQIRHSVISHLSTKLAIGQVLQQFSSSTSMGKTRNKTYLNTFKIVEEEMLPFVGEKENFMKDICIEFLSHNIIRLQLVKIGILFMLSFLDN